MATNFPGGVGPVGAYPPDSEFKKVLYVGNTSGLPAGDGSSRNYPLSSLFGTGGALAKAHPTLGTKIIVLKGHAENVSSADHASATGSNKRIYMVGEGEDVERPTLTWTTATSTWLFDTDSIILDNFNLNLEPGTGTINVAAPITMSGNGCGLKRLTVRAGTDANNKVTVGIAVTGDDCFMDDVYIHSATAAEATTFIRLNGADRQYMRNVRVMAATSAVGVGVVQFLTTASTNVEFEDCFFINRKALSTAAVSGLASTSGYAKRCMLGILDNATLTAWGTPADMQFYDCRVTNLAGEAGATFGTVSA